MEAGLFIRALALGFAVAAALGPIGLLVIRRTLARGRAYGLASGVGVAAADAAYAAVAAFGLTAVTEALVGADRALGVAGGAALMVIGARAVVTASASEAHADPVARADLVAAGVSIFGLTLANPMTILTFVALFAGLGSGSAGATGAMAITSGIFIGSLGWWAVLTAGVGAFRARLGPRTVLALNRLSGIVIAAFGALALAASLRS